MGSEYPASGEEGGACAVFFETRTTGQVMDLDLEPKTGQAWWKQTVLPRK